MKSDGNDPLGTVVQKRGEKTVFVRSVIPLSEWKSTERPFVVMNFVVGFCFRSSPTIQANFVMFVKKHPFQRVSIRFSVQKIQFF